MSRIFGSEYHPDAWQWDSAYCWVFSRLSSQILAGCLSSHIRPIRWIWCRQTCICSVLWRRLWEVSAFHATLTLKSSHKTFFGTLTRSRTIAAYTNWCLIMTNAWTFMEIKLRSECTLSFVNEFFSNFSIIFCLFSKGGKVTFVIVSYKRSIYSYGLMSVCFQHKISYFLVLMAFG